MKHFASLTAIAITCAAPLSAGTITDVYTSFFAFGDSLSDDGKLNLPLPYFEGQFSSGPVWSEIIGKEFTDAGRIYGNLALGGATAGDTNANVYPAAAQAFATFNSQIDVFEATVTSVITGTVTTALTGNNPLISVLLGANDIFQQGGGAAIAAANAVADGIERIAALGPQFDDFLVSTLPELGDPPGSSGFTVAGVFNQTLSSRLQGLDPSLFNIIDVNQSVFQANLDPFAIGVTNFDEPCLVPPTETTSGKDCTIVGFNADGTLKRDLSRADSYYLIDSVHPSGPIQAAFGAFALNAIEENLPVPVPLPATLPLALFGLAGLGAMGARRRLRG